MKYVVITNAADGRHVSIHASIDKANQKLRDLVGGHDGKRFVVGKTYYSDWGSYVTIEERPANWTLTIEHRIAKAYDAREVGIATAAQLKLLADRGF
jgi:hypothetical protein